MAAAALRALRAFILTAAYTGAGAGHGMSMLGGSGATELIDLTQGPSSVALTGSKCASHAHLTAMLAVVPPPLAGAAAVIVLLVITST
jgi:uncharacterized protein YaaW (UPF0174 family)